MFLTGLLVSFSSLRGFGYPLPSSSIHIPAAPKQEDQALLGINCGGGRQTVGGTVFEEDAYFTGGKIFTNPAIGDVAGTEKDVLYRKERSASEDRGSFSYNIPLNAGTYTVRLHFVELWWGATGGGEGGPGKRVFNLFLEGQSGLTNFDIYQEAGAMRAVVKTFPVEVSDGLLTLDFFASVNQPTVSAIEILTGEPQAECQWMALAPSAVERKEGQSAVVGGNMYTFGGYFGYLKGTGRTERYEPQGDRWVTLASMPIPVTHMGAVATEESVWLIGGFTGDHPGPVTDAVQVYHVPTNTWSFGPPLPAPRGSGAASRVGRKIHAFGGVLPNRHTDTGDHYVMDLDNLAAGWQTAAPLPEPRNHLGAVTVGGRIYAIGGQKGHDGGRSNTRFLHVYDPVTNAWTRLADLPTGRSHFEPGTLTMDGKILLVGGSDDNTDFADVLEYDPESNQWRTRCTLPGTLVAPFAKVLQEDRLIVAQGAIDNGAIPEKGTFGSRLARSPRKVAGFSLPQVNLRAQAGQAASGENLLWTLTGESSYRFNPDGVPGWLAVRNPTGGAGPEGTEIELAATSAGLARGTYRATLEASLPGYTGNTSFEVVFTVEAPPEQKTRFALNAGGAAYSAATGELFSEDTFYPGGNTFSSSQDIGNTPHPVLYQSERYGNFSYAFSLSNGSYRVVLHFAEIWWGAPGGGSGGVGARKFNVDIEGQRKLTEYDIFLQAGGSLRAVQESFTVNVTDGTLNLDFSNGNADFAKVSAIEVVPVAASEPDSYGSTEAKGELTTSDGNTRQGETPGSLMSKSGTARLKATGNEAFSSGGVSIFPNPAAHQLIVQLPFPARQVRGTWVSDLTGKVRLRNAQQVPDGQQLLIPITGLQPGLYLLGLDSPAGYVLLKFLKR
jgi:N-acetylneuraminic acid mutarotase